MIKKTRKEIKQIAQHIVDLDYNCGEFTLCLSNNDYDLLHNDELDNIDTNPSEDSVCIPISAPDVDHEGFVEDMVDDVEWQITYMLGQYEQVMKEKLKKVKAGKAGKGKAKVRGNSDHYRKLAKKRWESKE